jgi:hypothetical protein
VSLQGFQRAVVDLTLSFAKAKALRDGAPALLASYDLTPLEQERILGIVGQPGIAVHCSLSRGNRLEVVVNAFPMTCVLLKSQMRELMNELWELRRPSNYQLAGEEAAFAEFVGRKVAAGTLTVEYLAEIVAYETVCLDLTQRSWMQTSPDATVEAPAWFQHDPDDLLPPLARLTMPEAGLPEGAYPVVVRLHDKRFEVNVLSIRTGVTGS